MIDGQNFFDQRAKNYLRIHNVGKIMIGPGDYPCQIGDPY